MSKVLVIEDEAPLRRALRIFLEAHDYEVVLAATGQEGLELAAREHPDVVILDLGLPDMDGVTVASALRGWSATPIVVLSARDAEPVKVAALDAGADDYVTKPFGMNEFLARLRAALRRAAPTEQERDIATADFTIDLG
ncbi:MAG: two-component system, OmpR family, operon response regulator KdpE, partial [Actinomycetota bacterium]|nr:two-component system, OmpR family, operon response regulator KdpE [Actinomycetota bacterium]